MALTAAVGSMDGYLRRKDQVLGMLAGTVLEIGAGTGANFDQLPARVSWIGLEPRSRVHAALARNAVMHDRRPQILHAAAEEIPLPDASVDAVVSTTVLCSVADPARALGEIRRVLREGGRFVFFEHVVAPPGTCSRRLQRALAPFSRRFDHGCDPGRDTVATISEAGFAAIDLRWYAKTHRPALYGLFIAGIAQEGGPFGSSVGMVIAA